MNNGLKVSEFDEVPSGTLTGTTIQTESTANRGLKITSAGMKAYNGSGAETVSIDASTGNATFAGTVIAAPGSIVGADIAVPSSPHFSVTGVVDNIWHTIDLSSIVPAGYRSVLLRIALIGGTDVYGVRVAFNKYGETSLLCAARYWAPSGFTAYYDAIVPMDSSRRIQYQFTYPILSPYAGFEATAVQVLL